jgi:hypothetical protein
MSKMLLGFLKKALFREPALREPKRRASSYKSRILQAIAKRGSGYINGGNDMNEVSMLAGAEPREILQTVIEEKVPAKITYLSKGKWHVCKVQLTELGASRLNIQLLTGKRPQPTNIQIDQPVGISLKYRYGKFIFETKVTDFEPSSDPTSGGKVILAVPDRIEVVQRRSYFRVDVPKSLKVNVMLWHRCSSEETERAIPENYWQGKLIDISAGGFQVAIVREKKTDFKIGQFLGVRFTPMPYETPLMFNAQIRNTLPTADDKSLCLGLQIVGLEASPEGRQVLARLVSVVERYYQINQSSASQQDMQGSALRRPADSKAESQQLPSKQL